MTIGFRERELVLDLFELITGLRMNHAYIRPGGVAQDLPPGALDKIRDFVALMQKRLPSTPSAAATPTRSSRAALEDVGYLDLTGCMALGHHRPGAALDRPARGTCARSQPYCGYETYDFDVPTWDTCDAYGRFRIRLDEMCESLKIVEQAVDRLAGLAGRRSWSRTRRSPGPRSWPSAATAWATASTTSAHIMGESMEALIHHFKLVTEGFRVPAGPGLRRRSSRPAASSACHVVSDGGTRPYRAHFRDPSFTNLQATAAMCEGGMVADVIVAVASHRPRDGRSGPVMTASTPTQPACPTRPRLRPADDARRSCAPTLREIVARYPQRALGAAAAAAPGAERRGLRHRRGIEFCAEVLDLTAAEVTGVATFYTMYKRHPDGEYHVGVCTNTLCAVMGGDRSSSRLKEHLGVGHDETTDDGKITLEHIECNAACDYAPVVMVNWEFFDNQTPESATPAGRRPARGRRGPRPPAARRVCTFKEVARVLAGFPDGRADEGAGAGPASLRGPSGRPREQLDRTRRRGRAQGRAPGHGNLRRGGGRTAHLHRHPGERTGRAGRHQARRRREVTAMATTLTPVLTKFWDDPQSWTLETYRANDGYEALEKALAMEPADLVQMIKDSGLRGRGGAGFPTGMKWGFIPQGGRQAALPRRQRRRVRAGHLQGHPADDGQPARPDRGHGHHAPTRSGCNHAFIYVRGEVAARRTAGCSARSQEAYAAGYLGKNILGSGFDLEVTVHAGAGAYICGEETALLDSLEGRRGQPRLRPPFPAVAGLYACPTVVNNVESIASVPPILLHGAEWFAGMGTEKSKGFGIFCLSGHVKRPGQYEAPLGITLRELLDMAGGMRDPGHELKFWTPGGSSTPLFTAEHLDVPLDLRGASARRARCSAPAPCRSSTRPPAWSGRSTALDRVLQARVLRQVHAVPRGHLLAGADHCTGSSTGRAPRRTSRSCSTSATTSSAGRSAPSATARPARSPVSIQYFREEYIAHLTNGGCPFDPDAVHAVREGQRARMTTTTSPPARAPAATPSAPAATRQPRPPTLVTLTDRRRRGVACPRARW